ncbi:3481_t:CDS:2 [Entrophospora sp. SA101]|nr:3481_t:CDS:2 [Entrophospora sp. SA101]
MKNEKHHKGEYMGVSLEYFPKKSVIIRRLEHCSECGGENIISVKLDYEYLDYLKDLIDKNENGKGRMSKKDFNKVLKALLKVTPPKKSTIEKRIVKQDRNGNDYLILELSNGESIFCFPSQEINLDELSENQQYKFTVKEGMPNLTELREALFVLKLEQKAGRLLKTHQIKKIRKEIARVLTKKNQQKIMTQSEPEGKI